MKRRLLFMLVCFTSTMMVCAQTNYTFKAGMLNVDGLPPQILGQDINVGGPGSAGTQVASKYVADSGWDIVAFAEDFNYHSDLTSAMTTYYNFAKHSGNVNISAFLRAECDGLGMAVAKYLGFPGVDTEGTRVKWNDDNGWLTDGADANVTKGFRLYTVNFSQTIAVDVYVCHMDAETTSADMEARESQLKQLAAYIKNNHHNRPVIVIGDTNCRYTRDNLKELFVDEINKDSRLTINDAWIELIHNGEYPVLGSESMMIQQYGNQQGEVVDKVFYINSTETDIKLKANNYWNDAARLTISDHTPVMVSFTITDPDGDPIDNTLPGPDSENPETWQDALPTNPTVNITGKQYYLRNEYTGLFFKSGCTWGGHFAEGRDALPVQMTLVSGNTYKISTPTLGRYAGNNYYADNGTEAQGNWVVEEIKSTSSLGNNKTKYIFRNASNTSNAITSMANENGFVDAAAYNVKDSKQQWVLYTYDEMIATIKNEMNATVDGVYYNASGLVTQPVCNIGLDSRHTSGWSFVPSIGGGGGEQNGTCVWEVYRDGNSHAFDMGQTLSEIPNGIYKLRVQAFFRNGDSNTSSTSVEPVLYAGTKTQKICSILDYALAKQPSWTWGHQNAAGWIPNDMWQANQWFKSGYYWVEIDNIQVTNGSLKIGIKNTSTSTSQSWCCFDNFQLLYLGTADGDLKETDLYKNIKAQVDEANALMATLSPEAQAAYDISDIKWRYENGLLSLDGSIEKRLLDEMVGEAVKAQTGEGANLTNAIVNHSFEMGDLTGWNTVNSNDTGARRNDNGTYTTTGVDGDYLFNTWSADGEVCAPITQTIDHLPSGYYKLTASVTSHTGNSVYLVANNQWAGTNSFVNEKEFVDLSVKFLIEDAIVNIATVASKEGKFNYPGGAFFKADNYRLERIGSLGQGRVEIALLETDTRALTLTQAAQDVYNKSVAKYRGTEIFGDGEEEKLAIYTALKEATLSQREANAEMTWIIRNHSFENGTYSGWTVPTKGDTKVAHQNTSFYANYADGLYLFNTWNDYENTISNEPIKQTITGLPNGTYRLTASVTSGANNKVFVFANGIVSTGYIAEAENKMGDTSVEFKVIDGTAEIGVIGARDGEYNEESGCWYKADNFRLTFLHNDVVLNDTDEELPYKDGDWCTSVTLNRTVKADIWSTFVVPFDMEVPEKWSVMALKSAKQIKDVVSMTFDEVVDMIEAGVPYMVRTSEEWSGTKVENITLQSSLKPVDGSGLVTFKGNYISGNVPVGSFFMSGNNFYRAADETNTLKAFRGYFELAESANANVLNYLFDDEQTSIEQVEVDGNATVVAIYSVDGRRVEGLQRGINIVKLSDGKTKKVIVK